MAWLSLDKTGTILSIQFTQLLKSSNIYWVSTVSLEGLLSIGDTKIIINALSKQTIQTLYESGLWWRSKRVQEKKPGLTFVLLPGQQLNIVEKWGQPIAISGLL